MLARAESQAQVENALKVIDFFRFFDDVLYRDFLAKDPFVKPGVVFHVFRNFGGFFGSLVAFWNNVIPGQLAKAMQAKPGAPHGEVMQRFGFVLKGWQLLVHHFHKYQPGLVMLRTLGCQRIAALLSQRLLRQVFGNLHTFDFHANVAQQFGIRAILLNKEFAHGSHALTDHQAKAFSVGHLVNQLHYHIKVAPGKLQTAGMPGCNHAKFIAFHRKGNRVAERYGIDAVGVRVEIDFQNLTGVEQAQIGSQRA